MSSIPPLDDLNINSLTDYLHSLTTEQNNNNNNHTAYEYNGATTSYQLLTDDEPVYRSIEVPSYSQSQQHGHGYGYGYGHAKSFEELECDSYGDASDWYPQSPTSFTKQYSLSSSSCSQQQYQNTLMRNDSNLSIQLQHKKSYDGIVMDEINQQQDMDMPDADSDELPPMMYNPTLMRQNAYVRAY